MTVMQIGVAALRAPDGTPMTAIPLYISAEDANAENPHTGRTVAEDLAVSDDAIARLFAGKFKEYEKGVKKCRK